MAYGALLGVFLLGVLTQRANQTGAMVGMLCGFVTEFYLWLIHPSALDLVRGDWDGNYVRDGVCGQFDSRRKS